MKRIYLDHAATTPVDPDVVAAMMPCFERDFGNASSIHSFGQDARHLVEDAREHVAALMNAGTEEVIFTAGGTESDNMALKGIAALNRDRVRDHPEGPHIITSTIEHPAILRTCEWLETRGFVVRYLPVDNQGMIDVGSLEDAIAPGTFLVSIMFANNEIGTIEPVKQLGALCREQGVLFHTDAVQACGKVPVDVRSMNIDLLSLSSHKLHGPKGIGALYLREGVELEPIAHGGGHERGLRSSTENVPGIIGLAKAAELAKARMDEDMARLMSMRDHLISGVLDTVPASYLNGHPTKRLPHNAHFRFDAVEGESLVLALDHEGIASSSGSACSSKKSGPSHVLTAIGLDGIQAQGTLRLTLGRGNTDEDVDKTIEAVPRVVAKLRELSPLWTGGP